MKTAALLFLGFYCTLCFAETPQTGEKQYQFVDSVRNRTIQTFIWYPAETKSKTSVVSQGPFLPMTVAQDALIAPQKGGSKFPVVFLSHGSGGLAGRLFWLAEYLVQHNVVVIAVNHPGNMMGNNSGEGLMRVWDRAKDFSFVLDQVVKLPEFKDQLNIKKVAVAGHSAGGTTALLLAGARFSLDHFENPIPKCAGSGDAYYEKLCQELKKIDYKKYLKSEAEANYSDPRITAAVALDPGFSKSITLESIKAIRTPTLVFIADHLAEPQDEIYSMDFVGMLPKEDTFLVKNSNHMTFISACKNGVEKEEPELKILCSNHTGKLKLQKTIAEKILKFFEASWLNRR